MADPAAGLKIILPEKVNPLPEKPTHEWYMQASPEYKKTWKFYAAAAKMSGGGNAFKSDAKIKQLLPQLNLAYQKEYELNQMAMQNYNSLAALQAASDKVAAEQAQTVATLSAQRDAEMARLEQTRQQQAAQIAAQQIAQQQQIAERQGAQQALLAQQQAKQQGQIGAQRLATQAVSQSLRVLAGMASQSSAPTAPLSRRQTAGLRIKPTSATGSLRIGSSGRGSGVGVNLGG